MPYDPETNLLSLPPVPAFQNELEMPVDMAAIVPLEYWQPGADITPEPAAARLQRLQLLNGLSQNERLVTDDMPKIRPNYFGRAATFLGNLGSAFPPTLTGLPDEIGRPLERSIRKSINALLVDVVRYGTAVWRLRQTAANQPVLEQVDPRAWFPGNTTEMLNDDMFEDAIVVFRDADNEKWAQVLKLQPTNYVLSTYEFNGDLLGDLLDQQTGILPTERTIYPISLPPTDGEWGRSAFLDMYNLAQELGRRFTRNSSTLDDFARPMLVLKGRAANAVSYDGPNEMLQLQAKTGLLAFDDGRRQPVWALPDGIEDVSFVTWDAQQQASFQHLDRVEDALFDMSALPSGLGRMADKLASGASLRRLWAPTYVLLETLRSQIMDAIADAVLAASETLGIADPDFSVEWTNPLDVLDEQRIIQGGSELMDTDNIGGEE